MEDGSKMKSGRNQDTEYRIESSSMRSMFQVGVGRELLPAGVEEVLGLLVVCTVSAYVGCG